jgi:hypothetical protein
VLEAFNDVSVWIKDRLLEVFKGGKLRDTVTGGRIKDLGEEISTTSILSYTFKE